MYKYILFTALLLLPITTQSSNLIEQLPDLRPQVNRHAIQQHTRDGVVHDLQRENKRLNNVIIDLQVERDTYSQQCADSRTVHINWLVTTYRSLLYVEQMILTPNHITPDQLFIDYKANIGNKIVGYGLQLPTLE